MSGASGASPLSNYRSRRRWEINDLLDELTGVDCEPAAKEPVRRRLELLLAEVEFSRPGDRVLAARIRDGRLELEKFRLR